MKILRILILLLFLGSLLLPMVCFNFTPNSVSLIDNRKLAENPFTQAGSFKTNLENYVSDRIGFRDEMISAYTILNDKLFGKMVHPTYSYGKDGYIFGAGLSTDVAYTEFHTAFADMIASIQDYCESRDVPFLFVFTPAKPAVYRDKLPVGVNYDRAWVNRFLSELEQRGVTVLDNTETLTRLESQGISGFNQKFDANHWNDTGAFYGTRAMLERLQQRLPNIHVNELEEFLLTENLETSLAVSNFPVREYVPEYTPLTPGEKITGAYKEELQLHPNHISFEFYENIHRRGEDTPRALVFQGSYMNSKGVKFLANAFEEYIYIHDYQNVIDFPYYFHIFRPECVIVEVAEYTLTEHYFDLEKMCSIDYNAPLSACENVKTTSPGKEEITVQTGEVLTVITWETEEVFDSVWLTLGEEYDMQPVEGGYKTTVTTEDWNRAKEHLQIHFLPLS